MYFRNFTDIFADVWHSSQHTTHIIKQQQTTSYTSTMAGRATKRGGSGRGGPAKRGRSSSVGKKSSSGGDNDSDAKKLEETSSTIAKSKGATIDKVTYPRQSLPLLRSNTSTKDGSDKQTVVGYVRATPPGHLLQSTTNTHQQSTSKLEKQKQEEYKEWKTIRSDPLRVGTFPKEGFDHILGNDEIREVDGIPIGGRIVELDGPYPTAKNINITKSDASKLVEEEEEECLEPEEEEALQAELAQRRVNLVQMENGTGDDDDPTQAYNVNATDGHEYGASRTPLDAPIGSLREKWRVLPHFLKLRGLMKQHIDSFDHFVSVEMKQIVQVSVYIII